MGKPEAAVTFQPGRKSVRAGEGATIAEAAAMAGLALDMPCGGEGTCGKCRVIVREGVGEPGPIERRVFTAEELRQGLRLACQSLVAGAMAIEIPPGSLLPSGCKILARGQGTAAYPPDPPVEKHYVELPRPDRTSEAADLARLQRALGPLEADLDVLRELPRLLREADFRGTAVVADGGLVDFEPGDTRSAGYAVAVDVGTTTLVAMLVDLATGEEAAITARLNPQTAFGEDVLSRILYTQEDPQGLAELHGAVTRAIDEMIGLLVEQAGIDRRQIYEVCCSGNTTMQQLVCRVDPRHLGEVPFVPATSARVLAPAARLGLAIHPRGRAYVMPTIGGFVGGDTVSGILATALAERSGPTLLVDIGTNGEIVLAAGGKLLAASTAAGPAFEGARIMHGMRASVGAIEKVAVDGRLRVHVIGGAPPVGLCGSALIDVAAELLRHGLLTPDGRLRPPNDLPGDCLADLRRRVVLFKDRSAFLLVGEDESGTGKPVLLTQQDFRELQLATGAIRAGIVILLRRAGLLPDDLEAVLVAGGFGNFIRRGNAQRIGLLPDRIPRERIRYQGNTSLAGARLVAVSRQARKTAEALAARTKHVELSSDPDFRWAFAEAMIFPAEDRC